VIRNVIFDLGGVMITWRPQEIIDRFYLEPALRDAVRTHVFQHPDWVEMDRGTLDEPAAARAFARRMGRPISEMSALFEHVRASLKPIPASVELAQNLRARGLSLFALSNISEPMFRYLQTQNSFFDLFTGIVISGAIKMVKPEPEIFAHLAQRFSVGYSEAVFIDDHPANVEAARRLGLAAVLFENSEQCAAELEPLLNLPAP
jgi:putative hydrolase of the HAD superfamily